MTWANRAGFILVCVMMVFTTIAYGAVHQPILVLFYAACAALLVLWSIDGFKSGAIRFSREPLQLPLAATALYGAIQVLPLGHFASIAGLADVPRKISLDPFATQVNAMHFAALFLFLAILLVLLDSAGRIKRLAGLIFFFGAIYAFFGILQGVLSPDKIYGIYEAKAAPPFGSFVNRHNFAAYMEMSLAIPLGLMFVGAVKRDKRLLYMTGIGLMGVALIMSGSRGGLVALLAEIVLILMMTLGKKGERRWVLKGVLAAAMVGAIVAGSFFVGGESSLTRLAETAKSDDLTTDRSHIWSVTLKVIGANMPLGAGLGAFGIAYTQFDDRSGLERVEQAHNDYLQVLSDAGLVGALIGIGFLVVLFTTGKAAVTTKNLYRKGVAVGAAGGIFAIMVHSLFDFVLHTTAVALLFLALAALLSACRWKYEDDVVDEEDQHKRRRSRKASVESIDARRPPRPAI